jgi:phosphatidylglycerophosphate synthase
VPESRALTVAEARRRGQGDAHLDADPTYARAIVRNVSPYLTYTIVRHTPVSADSVTALAIACGVVGGVITAFPSPMALWLSIVLLQLAYVLDVVDGEVARVRGTSSRRGTYLDLIGHFVQNRALYAGSTFSLVLLTDFAWWAVAIAVLGVGFASAFGEQARIQVAGGVATSPHGARSVSSDSMPTSLRGRLHWLYRRVSFVWNYPASMNLFCVAILIDATRLTLDIAAEPLVLPIFAALFAVTLAAKQVMNAMRLLDRSHWEATA